MASTSIPMFLRTTSSLFLSTSLQNCQLSSVSTLLMKSSLARSTSLLRSSSLLLASSARPSAGFPLGFCSGEGGSEIRSGMAVESGSEPSSGVLSLLHLSAPGATLGLVTLVFLGSGVGVLGAILVLALDMSLALDLGGDLDLLLWPGDLGEQCLPRGEQAWAGRGPASPIPGTHVELRTSPGEMMTDAWSSCSDSESDFLSFFILFAGAVGELGDCTI